MVNLQKINKLTEEREVKIISFCKKINYTPQGLRKSIKNNNIMCDVLDRIAAYFNVPVGYFFDETDAPMGNGVNLTANGNNNKQSVALNDCHHKVELLEKEVEGMKKEIEGKDKIIKLLEEKK